MEKTWKDNSCLLQLGSYFGCFLAIISICSVFKEAGKESNRFFFLNKPPGQADLFGGENSQFAHPLSGLTLTYCACHSCAHLQAFCVFSLWILPPTKPENTYYDCMSVESINADCLSHNAMTKVIGEAITEPTGYNKPLETTAKILGLLLEPADIQAKHISEKTSLHRSLYLVQLATWNSRMEVWEWLISVNMTYNKSW